MKDVEHVLWESISIWALIRRPPCFRHPRRRRLGYCDHRALRYVLRRRLKENRSRVFDVCVPSYWRRKDFEWLVNDWNGRCSFRLEWYLPLPLRFQSDQRHLQCYPWNGDLRHRHWHRPLRCPEGRRWEFVKMCQKDVCYFRPLGFGGLRLRLGSPLPFVHLHIGGLTMMC